MSSDPQAIIQAQVLRRILDACPIDDATRRQFLAEESLNPDDLTGTTATVPLRAYLRIFDRLAVHLNRPALGLQLSSVLGPEVVGAIGFLFLHSPTLEAALTAYSQSVFSIQGVTQLTFTQGPQPAVSYAITDDTQHPRRQDVEFSLGQVNALIRRFVGRGYAPLEVHLEHPRIGHASTYDEAFGCAVYFEQPRNAILLNPADLQRASPTADPGLAAILRHYLQLVDRRDRAPDTWTARVRDAITGSDFAETPTLDQVAGRLGLGPHALQRRLATEGTNLRSVILQKRMAMAQRHLVETRLSVLAIATLLGYSETASFSRAFKAHCGEGPRQFRARNT